MRGSWWVACGICVAFLATVVILSPNTHDPDDILPLSLTFGGIIALVVTVGILNTKTIKAINGEIYSQLHKIGIPATKIDSKYLSRSQIQLDKVNKQINPGNVLSRGMDDWDIKGVFDISGKDIDYIFFTVYHDKNATPRLEP